jgi:hypothetical protein
MSSADRAPRILCAGIIVLDEVFRVDEFPQPDGKVQARGFSSSTAAVRLMPRWQLPGLGAAPSLQAPWAVLRGRTTTATACLKL